MRLAVKIIFERIKELTFLPVVAFTASLRYTSAAYALNISSFDLEKYSADLANLFSILQRRIHENDMAKTLGSAIKSIILDCAPKLSFGTKNVFCRKMLCRNGKHPSVDICFSLFYKMYLIRRNFLIVHLNYPLEPRTDI